jgi:hypothetical protein
MRARFATLPHFPLWLCVLEKYVPLLIVSAVPLQFIELTAAFAGKEVATANAPTAIAIPRLRMSPLTEVMM